jgi:23S rRNA pseudouridine1911/1915/1917 synthase
MTFSSSINRRYSPAIPGGYTPARMLSRERPELAFGLDGVRLANRLDRETSGIVVVAKTQEAAAFASARLQDGSLIKEYHVLVEGVFPEYLDAAGWLGRDGDSPIRKKARFSRHEIPGGQAARTEFWSVDTRVAPGGDRLSLVRARLHTGRTHQIRATLHSLNFPVVGDKMYGRDPTIFLRFAAGIMTEADEALLRMPHQALHCAHVSFPKMEKAPAADYDILAERLKSWIA